MMVRLGLLKESLKIYKSIAMWYTGKKPNVSKQLC